MNSNNNLANSASILFGNNNNNNNKTPDGSFTPGGPMNCGFSNITGF